MRQAVRFWIGKMEDFAIGQVAYTGICQFTLKKIRSLPHVRRDILVYSSVG